MGKAEKLNINEWAVEDRPREKMLLKGILALRLEEICAILLGAGNKKDTAVELSQRILNDVNNSLNQLGKLSVDDLSDTYDGIGEAKAISIIAALELGRRRKSEKAEVRKKILSSRDVYDLFYPQLADLPHEEFWVAFLKSSNKVIDKVRVGQGGTTFSPVDIRLVLKPAVQKLASGLILCHNHPSSTNKPSRLDIELTRKIKEAAALFDIRILDHIIFCDDGYFSFADEGIL